MTATGTQPTEVNGDAVGEVRIYQCPDGSVRLDVRTDGDTVRLIRQQIGDLFGRDVKTIGKLVVIVTAADIRPSSENPKISNRRNDIRARGGLPPERGAGTFALIDRMSPQDARTY